MANDLISRSALLEEFQFGLPLKNSIGAVVVSGCVATISRMIEAAPAVDAVAVGSCDGCYWKEIGRQQKCSCCRRNRYLKDNYERRVNK